MLKTVEIKNYKSIKDLHLDCKRINLFIGKPNVGKSNILEAISLLQDGIGAHIRKEDMRNLFFDQDVTEDIEVKGNELDIIVGYHSKVDKFYYIKTPNHLNLISDNFFSPSVFYEHLIENKRMLSGLMKKLEETIYKFYDNQGNIVTRYENVKSETFQIKPYLFKKGDLKSLPKEDGNLLSLSYPHGQNLFTVLKSNKTILKEVALMFKEYGYDLLIDFVSDHAEIQKNVDGVVYKIPYSLIADTLHRAIFHSCAIASNKGNVLLFEEPENHSFPPYIRELALKIIESNDNQFFIATHSPYLLNTFISETPKEDIAINLVNFDNFQTKIHTLTQEELSRISNYGIDIFFNLNLFES